MGKSMAQNRPPNNYDRPPSAALPPFVDTVVDYWNVQKWSPESLQKGLHHDFVVLGRYAVAVHYNHKPDEDCIDKCELMVNPNKEIEGNNE